MRWPIPLLGALLGCGGPPDRTVPAGTGEEAPGLCGDGTVDPGEACDDGNALGGDGCTERCAIEAGQLETEPNDRWDQATPWDGAPAHGGLTEGDVDCWSLDAPACGALTVWARAPCNPDVVLTLHDPTGAGVAVGTADEQGCARIDPVEDPGADHLPEGPHAVCVSALAGPVPSYAIEAALADRPAVPARPEEDLDGDGAMDRCDPDRDGDGVEDGLDNCVEVPNGPAMDPPWVSDQGFIRDWLLLGPITGTSSALDCLPSDQAFLGDDGAARPELGQAVGGLVWIAWFDRDDHIDLLPILGSVGAPREAYASVYLNSPVARTARLALGADDGVRSWWNGVQVHDVSSCQGASPDQFVATVDVLAGWNALTLKIRDQGGGWGLYARLLDLAGDPLTDLEISLSAAGPWVDDQSDGDGDGLGDVCDPSP